MNMGSVNILMVCLGNICRSPLAEGILREKARQKGLDIHVESAGTGAWHIGQPPHPLSQKIAAQKGVNISGQRAKKYLATDIVKYDFVYFMDQQNMDDARSISGKNWVPGKAALMLDLLPNQPIREVPDPYYGDFDDYTMVFNLLDEACERIIEKLQSFDDRFE
jgi:protein-tyrosine phosphatase